MKPGEQKVTYWVMYEERVQKDVAAWYEPRNIQWVERITQHCGVRELEKAQHIVANLQQYVDNKTHFLEADRSGPEMHHLTETWIEIEHRCRFDPNAARIPSITLCDSAGAIEANPAVENSQET